MNPQPSMMPPGPFLETQRLWLRPMQAEDTDALLAIFGDPELVAVFEMPPFGREQMAQWVQHNLDHQTVYGYGLFAILHKTDGLLIGDCGLQHLEVAGRTITELGYDVRRDYWNQGYATEAAGAVRDFAWQQLQFPYLNSFIRIGNQASRRVAEKIGMRCIGKISRLGNLYWLYQIDRT